jgi:cytochrome b subunit of formate dehydrogenase/DnaJ-class molecular chaperone
MRLFANRGATSLVLGVFWVGLGLCAGHAGAQDETCLECHAAAAGQVEKERQVDGPRWSASLHAQAGVGCESCHAGKKDFPHEASNPTAACAECHDAGATLATSVHGRANAGADAWPVSCSNCHGDVHVLVPASDAASPVHPKRLPETCGSCHASERMAKRAGQGSVQPLAAYAASVHARGVAEGAHAATCSDCHGGHGIFPAGDPRSTVFHQRVPATCAKCHGEISTAFAESVHGVAAARGVRQAPVCIDCHGEHKILGPQERGSPVYASNVPKMTCGRCHSDLRVTERFGLSTSAVSAFEDSFHGLAGRAGDATVANCSSCHGVHDILPSSNPKSHISPARLSETCGRCHPGAGENFAIGSVHVLPEDQASAHPATYWVRWTYLWLIGLTIGGMALHNVLDLRRKVLSPISRPVVPVPQRRPRLNLGFRLAHGATALSFIVLVVTGFALKFPESGWAAPLLAWDERLGLRGWVHRAAAIVMLAAFLFHFGQLAIDRRARACILRMWPHLDDLRELKERFRWFLGKRADMPHSPALGYAEKAEYLALLWGTAVMAMTGFLLWFENVSLRLFPKWVTDVATVVHYYEAILASLAILVWHFYFVMFDPLVYPMDTAWYTGKEPPGRTLERTESVVEAKEKTRT